ncbi:queuosine precursor transporter [Alkalibacillus sp. S2W]|uniref:queuosine precursor transporter n=1 Tax=Alkalibacillus sp. S2W TaxID=3386553 RepID=UPI00398D40C6
MNEILFFVTLAINFIGILLFYKLFGKTGLFAWIAFATVIANIEVVKSVNIFGLEATLGNVVYATIFLATDLLNEKYGKEEARKSVFVGLASMAFFVIMIQVDLNYVPNSEDFAHEPMETLFSITPRIMIASFVAYFISQLLDVYIFDAIKRKTDGKFLFIRNNISTAASQLVDSFIFTFIAFLGVFGFSTVVMIGITTYLLKLLVAILDTPIIYLARKMNGPVKE